VQHALRAFTPRDAKALKAAVTTYPETNDYDLEEDLTQLGIGEAMVTILSERGAPTPVVWTRMQPPTSLMAAVPADQVDAAAHADPLWPRYAEEIDRESAREKLTAKLAAATEASAAADDRQEADTARRPATGAKKRKRAQKKRAAPADDGSPVVDFLKSREGRSAASAVTRGAMGVLKGFLK
jgi:hypothetical protein